MTQYLYGSLSNPFQVTASRSPDNVLTVYYYDDYGALYALERGGVRYYVGSDHLGTPKVVTYDNGTIIRQIEYDSWGVRTGDTNPGFDLPVGFASGIPDDATGLVRFGYRDYEPGTGRWTAKDPIFFRGGYGNLFNYGGNDPINKIDRSGLADIPVSPPGVSFDRNIRDAQKNFNPFWFYNQVRNHGSWDYKQQGSKYQDFGNFNYGATGAAFGIPDDVLLRGAGWAQEQAGTSDNSFGHWWGLSPYGDDPADHEMIRQGILYYRRNYGDSCPSTNIGP